MRCFIVWLIVGVPLALVAVAAGAAAVPTIRHMVSGLWYVPDHLPALPDNCLVHYQPGAEPYARDVAALLPNATTRAIAAATPDRCREGTNASSSPCNCQTGAV